MASPGTYNLGKLSSAARTMNTGVGDFRARAREVRDGDTGGAHGTTRANADAIGSKLLSSHCVANCFAFRNQLL